MDRDTNGTADSGDALSDCALDWLARLHSGRAGAAEAARFQAWRGRSPAHEAAAREAEALWGDLGRVRRPLGAPVRPRPPVFRRAAVALATAAGLALLAVGLDRQVDWLAMYADHATGVGERGAVILSDGSRLTLGARSAVSVAMAGGARRVTLLRGRARFQVARDPSRPFVVSAGAGEVRVLGTVFQVALADTGARVFVSEGRVEVAGRTGEAVRLTGGGSVRYDGDGRLDRAFRPLDPRAETAWLRGKAIFERSPLRDVVAAVAPYYPGRLVVLTDRAAAMRLTGVFDLRDAEGLLRAVERSLPVSVTRTPLVTVIR